jgi:hypothetical protein
MIHLHLPMRDLGFSEVIVGAILALSVLVAAPLAAQEIGVADKDGCWMLLQNPTGKAGEGLNRYAGDPGLPVLNPLGWPSGNWPTTELWHFAAKTSEFTQSTQFLGGYEGEASRENWRRTLLSVVRIKDVPYVLHYDQYKYSGHTSSLLRVDELAKSANGRVPGSSVAFKSNEFFDAPEVSPDASKLALRFWVIDDKKYKSELRVYSVADFTLLAKSALSTHSRPVWTGEDSLAVMTWDAGEIPHSAALRADSRAKPKLSQKQSIGAGKLISMVIEGDKINESELGTGTYFGDKTRRTLVFDGTRLGWVELVEGKHQVYTKDLAAKTAPKKLTVFKIFQGLAAVDGTITATGYDKNVSIVRAPIGAEQTAFGLRAGDKTMHASMHDFGDDIHVFAEPVANPGFSISQRSTQTLIRHTLRIPALGFDSLRNPRALVQMSGMMRSFAQFDAGKEKLPSTLLAFDVKIEGNQGGKSGRMIEIFHAGSRKGKGAIRVEDNLGGSWMMRSIYDRDGKDYLYVCSNLNKLDADGEIEVDEKNKNLKDFGELESQLNARRMLTLTNAANGLASGGLEFFGRTTHTDPTIGVSWNVATYLKQGRKLANGKFEKVWLTFVTTLPTGSAGDWAYPHALCKAQLQFALAGQRGLSVTKLMFDPDKYAVLNRLTISKTKTYPTLIVPGGFRIYNTNDKGKLERAVTAVLVTGKQKHDQRLIRSGEIESGYFVPSMGRNFIRKTVAKKFTRATR